MDTREYASLGDLTRPQLPETDYQLPGVGLIRIRPLSRAEAVRMHDLSNAEKREQFILSHALVKPTISEADARNMAVALPGGILGDLMQKIAEISGLHTEVETEETHRFRE